MSSVWRMVSKRQVVGLLIAAIGGLIIFARHQQPVASSPVPNGGLIVESGDLNFGEQIEQDSLKMTIRVVNPTSRTVRVNKLRAHCKCTKIEPQSFELAAGEVMPVRVELDLREKEPRTASRLIREFQAQIMPDVASSVPSPTERWTISGSVRRAIVPQTDLIDFADVSILDRQPRTLAVNVECLDPAVSLTATCDPNCGKVDIVEPSDASNLHQVLVTLNRELPLGRGEFPVQLTPKTRDGATLPSRSVLVAYRVVNDIQVVPPEAALGIIPVGNSVEKTVSLRSRTGSSFTVQSIETSSGAVSLSEPQPSDARATCQMLVRPDEVGTASGVVKFKILSGGTESIVSLKLSYVAVAAPEITTQAAITTQSEIGL